MTLPSPWDWRETNPIRPVALLLSGNYVCYLTAGQEPTLFRIDRDERHTATHESIAEAWTRLRLIEVDGETKIYGTVSAGLKWRAK